MFFTLTASAVVLVASLGASQAQQSTDEPATQQQDQQGQGMMGSGMGMNPEMMQQMQQMMGHGGMMRIMFAVSDADGNGALSLQEINDAHARIFKHVDANKDDQVTLEEVQAFFRGAPSVVDTEDMDEMDE